MLLRVLWQEQFEVRVFREWCAGMVGRSWEGRQLLPSLRRSLLLSSRYLMAGPRNDENYFLIPTKGNHLGKFLPLYRPLLNLRSQGILLQGEVSLNPTDSCTEATTARQLSKDFQMPMAGPRVDRGRERAGHGQASFLEMTRLVMVAKLLWFSLFG